jgi:hypothetical protein
VGLSACGLLIKINGRATPTDNTIGTTAVLRISPFRIAKKILDRNSDRPILYDKRCRLVEYHLPSKIACESELSAYADFSARQTSDSDRLSIFRLLAKRIRYVPVMLLLRVKLETILSNPVGGRPMLNAYNNRWIKLVNRNYINFCRAFHFRGQLIERGSYVSGIYE